MNKGAPLGIWKFDECQGTTANDDSGSGYNGTIYSGGANDNTSAGTCSSGAGDEMWDNGTTGKRNASLDFDGSDDYVLTGNMAPFAENNINYQNVSWSAWVNPAVTPVTDTIMQKSLEFRLTTNASGEPECEIRSSAVWQTPATIGTALSAGTWTHIVCTFDGTNIKIYVDGSLVGTEPETGSPLSSDASGFYVGRTLAGTEYYDGQIDEVKIWGYALSQQQVSQEYTGGAVRFE